MADSPTHCPTCSALLPSGATRCPACGSVWGEANRCPHCHAIAAVRPAAEGYLCVACGKPRDAGPGTTIFEHLDKESAAPNLKGARSAGLRTFGILSIAGGVLGAALAAAFLPGALAIVAAIAIGGAGVALGGLSLRSASRGASDTTATELAIFRLAEKSGGALSVTDVARGLRISVEEADGALTALADGSRVWAEVTPEGLVRYVFRELDSSKDGVKVRVESVSDTSEELAEAEREIEEMLESSRTAD